MDKIWTIFSSVKRYLIRLVLCRTDTEAFWTFRRRRRTTKNPLAKIYYAIRCERICARNGAFIPPNAHIEEPINLPHGLCGVFISQRAKIGKNCTIFQQVTIGSNLIEGSKGYGAPVLEDNVYVGAGAKIIGRCRIGENAKIGAGAVVVKDVPANATVVCAKPITYPPPPRTISLERMTAALIKECTHVFCFFEKKTCL